jgi:broad specificity phosphatase PhoE
MAEKLALRELPKTRKQVLSLLKPEPDFSPKAVFYRAMGLFYKKWPRLLVVVRHGQSEQNVATDLTEKGAEDMLRALRNIRDADIGLSERGLEQAEKTGNYLRLFPKFDVCFSSPYKRAMHTAEIMAYWVLYPLKIYNDNRLREKEAGRLHHLGKRTVKERYPDEYAARQRDGKYWYRLLGGENYPDVEMRMHSFLGKLTRDWGGKRVLVSTHHVPCIAIRTLIEHLDEKQALALGDIPNCGIQVYALDTSKSLGGKLVLMDYNRVAYPQDDDSSILPETSAPE